MYPSHNFITLEMVKNLEMAAHSNNLGPKINYTINRNFFFYPISLTDAIFYTASSF